MKREIKVRCALLPSMPGEAGEDRDYELEMEGDVTVLNVLEHIYRFLDGELSFYSYCRQGLCGGCLVEVNGKRVMACKTPALDRMEIKPIVETDGS